MLVAVGSTNPTKIEAVKLGFTKIFPEQLIDTQSVAVPSGVSAQPLSANESIIGARNRAHNAFSLVTNATYAVGLEGGVEREGDSWFGCGWCVVLNNQFKEGIASSARILIPKQILNNIQAGMELGDSIDLLFHTTNAKQTSGHFGLMTNNAVTRTDAYVQAVCLAASRFIHSEIFL